MSLEATIIYFQSLSELPGMHYALSYYMYDVFDLKLLLSLQNFYDYVSPDIRHIFILEEKAVGFSYIHI